RSRVCRFSSFRRGAAQVKCASRCTPAGSFAHRTPGSPCTRSSAGHPRAGQPAPPPRHGPPSGAARSRLGRTRSRRKRGCAEKFPPRRNTLGRGSRSQALFRTLCNPHQRASAARSTWVRGSGGAKESILPMAGINKAILIGNFGRDPELRYTQGVTAVCTPSIATTRSYNNRNNERVEETEWHRVVVWSKQAEFCNQYLTKGRQVYIEGRLQTRSYDDKDGIKRYSTEVVA